jgi:site-specific DNA recombinase
MEFCLRVSLGVGHCQHSIEATHFREATVASPSVFTSGPGNLNIMDDVRRDAIYARVSSQRQADEATIQSQVAALENRVQTDGGCLEPEMRFLDDGYSGTTLQRPALDLFDAAGERLAEHRHHQRERQSVACGVFLPTGVH